MNLEELRRDLESDAVVSAVRGRKLKQRVTAVSTVCVMAIGAAFFAMPRSQPEVEAVAASPAKVEVEQPDDFYLSDEELLSELEEFGPLLAMGENGAVELILTSSD